MQKIIKNTKESEEKDIVRNTAKNIIKKQTGITLIALVITIIVLLILAGISIATLTGNNGILTQASKAKENTAKAEEDEKNRLDANNDYIDQKLGNIVSPGETAQKTKKNNYTDTNGDKATIPEGFTVDETENTISSGLVVHGPDKANSRDNGSEFVWVPVPDINNMAQCSTAGGNCNLQLEGDTLKCTTHDNTEIVGKLYATELYNDYIDNSANTTYNANSGLREPAVVTGNTQGTGTSYDNNASCNNNLFTLSSLKTDYKNMATNVAKYGGFYVGRYETSLSDADETSAGTTGKVQSKQGVMPTSAGNSATSMWYGLYSKQNKTYTGTNNSVESSMIWGSQYDRILNWVKEGTNEEEKAKLENTSLGNHSSGVSVTTTGNSSYLNDSINNIRDLGGNLFKWTLEASYTNFRVLRGGDYGNGGSPSYRSNNFPSYTDSSNGSRLALYIK